MSQPVRLLMLCLGNICRSPMAEGAFRARLQAAGLEDDVQVDSAGIGPWHAGEPPDPRAIACARGHGVDIAGQRARQLAATDFQRFDWILAADADNLQALQGRRPRDATARATLLLPWATGEADAAAIPDPYTGDAADFERVWAMVDGAAEAAVRQRVWQRRVDG